MPSSSIKFFKIRSLFFSLNKSEKFFIDLKKLAKIFAFSCPICLIPIEKINLSRSISFDLFIAFFKLSIDNSPHPSSSFILL